MSKSQPKPTDLGEVIARADSLEKLLPVIKNFYGSERTAKAAPSAASGVDFYSLHTPSGAEVQMTYVYQQWDVFHFAFKPRK